MSDKADEAMEMAMEMGEMGAEQGGAAERQWSDESLRALARSELIDFGEREGEAQRRARAVWELLEGLREDPEASQAQCDAPSSEAFWALRERELAERLAVWGAVERSPFPAPALQGVFRSGPIEAKGERAERSAGDGDGRWGRRDASIGAPQALPPAGAGERLALEALERGVAKTAALARSGEIDLTELALSFKARCDRLEPALGAFESVSAEERLRRAAHSPVGLLSGVALGVKSLFWREGEPCSAGSRALEGFIAPASAPPLAGCLSLGAFEMGVCKMDELAMGSTGETSAFGPTRSPWDLERSPGGSSSGSAAAVASGMCVMALGSDTGGSVRQPASHCGLFGLKPTYGALSRFGMVPYAFSLDCPGAIARSAHEAAMALEACASGPRGWDEREALLDWGGLADRVGSALEASRWVSKPLAGLRVGLPIELCEDADLDPSARDASARMADALEGLGAIVTRVDLSEAQRALEAYYLLACCEAQSGLARYDGLRFGRAGRGESYEQRALDARSAGLGFEAKRRILVGAMALSEPSRQSLYGKAVARRSALSAQFAAAFESVDALVSPVCAVSARRLGEALPDRLDWLQDKLTTPASLAGIPALSAPFGAFSDGMPLGMQWMGPWFAEERLLRAAGALSIAMGRERSPLAL